MAELPDVAMSPDEKMVIAAFPVPGCPIVPTLMPAANVPEVVMLLDEIPSRRRRQSPPQCQIRCCRWSLLCPRT
jgi:hypothetical protein